MRRERVLSGGGSLEGAEGLVGGDTHRTMRARQAMDVLRYQAAVGGVRGIESNAELCAGLIVSVQRVHDLRGELQLGVVRDAEQQTDLIAGFDRCGGLDARAADRQDRRASLNCLLARGD